METDKKSETVFNMNQANPPETPKKKKGFKKILVIIVLIIYSVVLIGATYFITTAINERNLKGVLTAFHNPNNPLFLNLTGTANGKIVEIKGEKAWVETDKGGKLILSIKEPVLVSEISGDKLTEIGKTIDKIKLNQTATIRVEGYGSGYIITAVTYFDSNVPTFNLQAASASAKPASPSAKTKN